MALSTRFLKVSLWILPPLLILALLALFFPRREREKAKESPPMFTITEDMISSLISENIAQKFPLQDLTAQIAKDGQLTLNGTISSSKLREVISENQVAIPSGARLMLRLLPEKVHAVLVLSISANPAERTLSLTPLRFEINKIDIAPKLLPAVLNTGIADAANAYLREHNLTAGHVTVEDGRILISE